MRLVVQGEPYKESKGSEVALAGLIVFRPQAGMALGRGRPGHGRVFTYSILIFPRLYQPSFSMPAIARRTFGARVPGSTRAI